MSLVSVEYLNAVPLHWGLLQDPSPGFMEMAFTTPAECARRLAENQASIALLPVVEYPNIPGLQIVPRISISSFGPVRSVLLLANLPLEKVASVALDQSSRTSAILAKIILERVYGLQPTYVTAPPNGKAMLAEYDAALLIGDAALRSHANPQWHSYDLAAEWARFCGLPFVFAFWAVRPSPEIADTVRRLHASKAYGLEHLREIAVQESSVRGLTPEFAYEYLNRHIDYSLGPAQLAGLELFYHLAVEQGLLSSPCKLEFYP